MNDTKMIKCENIHKSYGTLEVLRGVSLEVSQGEVVSVAVSYTHLTLPTILLV